MNYAEFFKRATGNTPYPYQERLAQWPGGGWPALLQAPTGAGKTDAVVLAWLWRRLAHPEPEVRQGTPRRLVYCLPMRTLVEQTNSRTLKWRANLELENSVNLAILMGGETSDDDWRRHPEKPAIIIGTQDMLLSRALNRGYAQSPYQWPIDFGLLNNDCLWVLDEVQLMQNGLPTSAQLAAFRQGFGVYGPTHTLWMSATLRPEWLQTVDFPAPAENQVLALSDDDRQDARLRQRNQAVKTLRQLDLPDRPTPTGGQPYHFRRLAQEIIKKHQPGTRTLAVFNTVARAQGVFQELQKVNDKGAGLLLVHSRFRLEERRQLNRLLDEKVDRDSPGRIIIATQAVEAGVDLDARTLFTDLAPWPSLVQRFGRCNRAGEFPSAEVYWLDFPNLDKRQAAPYEPEDLERARERLLRLEGDSVDPACLPALDSQDDPRRGAVLRRRDLLGLFDTTPDLSGNYLDVSRFVRDSEDTDVSVFWREWDGEGDPPDDLEKPQTRKPQPREICQVRVGYVREYLGQKVGARQRRAWRWDYLDEAWEEVSASQVRPGQTLLLRAADGGYTTEQGWSANSKAPVTPAFEERQSEPAESNDSDPTSTGQKRWVKLQEHSLDVRNEAQRILSDLNLPELAELANAILTAAHYHDAGKAHPVFQKSMISKLAEEETAKRKDTLWAKRGAKIRPEPYKRSRFRHEVASALALLHHKPLPEGWLLDLAAYLALAHHGKARLALRSLPGKGGQHPDAEYLLGFQLPDHPDGKDRLPAVDLGDGVSFPEIELDLSLAHIGQASEDTPSWLERALGLRERLGPFRLAYLEALVRMADWRASAKEQNEVNP